MAEPALKKEPKPMDRLAMDILLALARLRDEVRAITKEVARGSPDE